MSQASKKLVSESVKESFLLCLCLFSYNLSC